MLRDNLKAAIGKSGMIVKEIAAKSGVKKRTIDKWVGTQYTEPKVYDFYKVCQTLGITIEWAVDGDGGTEYIKKIIRNDPKSIQVPDKIRSIVDALIYLDDKELIGVRANVEALAKAKSGISVNVEPDEQDLPETTAI